MMNSPPLTPSKLNLRKLKPRQRSLLRTRADAGVAGASLPQR
jgi:hypothetical protein